MQPAISILIKPASGSCNLKCEYCFYADEMCNRNEASYGIMSIDTLESIVRKTLEQVTHTATFAFQGGEPTLVGLDFYRKLIAFENRYNKNGVRIQNSIQTNGILLNEEWAVFLHENHFLVGLSLDGYQELHDLNRKYPDGSGSFSKVLSTAHLLEKYHVDFNILSVVTAQSARRIKRIYQFFRNEGFVWQQYIPCIDAFDQQKGQTSYSLTPEKYGRFLKDLFDCWYQDLKAGKHVYNRTFENWIGILLGMPPESCNMNGFCSQQWVIEADGSVFPCDFYVLDEWKLGNINYNDFEQMQKSSTAVEFISRSRHIPCQCKACKWYPLCRNGCRRDRGFCEDGITPDLNLYCESFQDFFQYAYPRMCEIARNIK